MKRIAAASDNWRHTSIPDAANAISSARTWPGSWKGPLRFFNGTRYDLEAWILMPNHVHVLFTQRDVSLSLITGSWKSYTAKQANRILGRSGQFWAEDYWDTYMRDDEHEVRTRHYIENNPVKAHLVFDPHQWPWSSVRFRDDYGQLRLPA